MPKWDEMTARQRDVAIAKLLGWHVETVGSAPMGYEGPHVSHPWQPLQHIPHYTTDPAAALQLAEAMRKDGWNIHIDMTGAFKDDYYEPDGDLCYPYECRVWRKHDPVPKRGIKANTLAEAIGHAAFLLLGGEE